MDDRSGGRNDDVVDHPRRDMMVEESCTLIQRSSSPHYESRSGGALSACVGGDGGSLIRHAFNLDQQRFESMGALEILRETIRILRQDSTRFLAIAAVLLCPVSAVILSHAFVSRSLVRRLSLQLLLVVQLSGLPSGLFLKDSCLRVSEMILSAIFCSPLFMTLSVLAKAAIFYSVACAYAGTELSIAKLVAAAAKIWRRLALIYLWISLVILTVVALFVVLLTTACNTFMIFGAPADLIKYAALALTVVFFVAFAHTIIICNLATVVSVLENSSGPQTLLRSLFLIKEQRQVGLLIFLGSTAGLAFVEGLFEYRVKTLSYGDGTSRIWEGPLLVIMYSFLLLIDSMMSAVFYFTCRSSCLETMGGISQEASPKFSGLAPAQ
ncbi:uncharacterized protein LOC116258162 [Nymphaea colorata]|nr:uncharacterized protein LOC116258162 [Nymphaea colorata]